MIDIDNYKLESKYLIKLLSSVQKNLIPPNPDADVDFYKLYELASFHCVNNTIYYGIIMLPKEFLEHNAIKLFKESCFKGSLIELTQKQETEKILCMFEENKIKCMPLKGYVIRSYYRSADMRSMGDIDILADEKDLHKAKEIMFKLGYCLKQEGINHDVYYKPPLVYIELHRALIGSSEKKLKSHFKTGWQYSKLKENSKYIYKMSNEDYYVYMIAHLAKHFKRGGAGIRFIMDIWVYNNYFKDKLDWEYINEEFRKSELLTFSNNIKQLSKVWFDDADSNELLDEMSEYIISNGTFGTTKNATASMISKGNGYEKEKIKYLLYLVFPSYERMVCLFPRLKRFPFLLPVYWLIRGIIRLFFRKKKVFEYLFAAKSVSKKEVNDMKSFLCRSGL